jgi:integrase
VSRLKKRGKYYYYRNGYEYFSLKTEVKSRAEIIRKKLDEDRELSRFGIFTPSDISVKTLKNEWIQFIKHDKTDSWWKSNLHKIDLFIKIYGERPVASIHARDINLWIGSLKKDHAPNTVLNYLKPIRQMLKFAVSNGYIDRNPMKSAQLPIAKEKRRFKAIPKDILFKIFANENIELKHRQFWMLCYFTGLDSGDAGMLIKKDVRNGVIQLERDKSNVPVQIPLHSKLDFNIFETMPTRSNRGWSSKLIKRELKKYDIHGSIKNLRASFISHLHDLGLGMSDIKVAVGHTSEKMTAHYTTKQLEMVKNNIEKL